MLHRKAGETFTRALEAAGRRKPERAYDLARPLLDEHGDADDVHYEEWVRYLAEWLATLGEGRAAAAAWAYVGELDRALDALPSGDLAPMDEARLLEAKGSHAEAAAVYAAHGAPVRAAIAFEHAHIPARAAAAWRVVPSYADPYLEALRRANLGVVLFAGGDSDEAKPPLDHAVETLARLADAAEAHADRERAFDCHGALRHIGLARGDHDLACNALSNRLRLLFDDGLHHFADETRVALHAQLTAAGRQVEAAAVEREVLEAAARRGPVSSGWSYFQVWHVDLTEQELAADIHQTAFRVLTTRRLGDAFRRRALTLLLFLVDARRRGQAGTPFQIELVRRLGGTHSYDMIALLEPLAGHPDPAIRLEVVSAAGALAYTRALALLHRAAADTDPLVRGAVVSSLGTFNSLMARAALRRLHDHATDPRIKAEASRLVDRLEKWRIESADARPPP